MIGVMGGGQLGRMLALAAARLGERVRCFDYLADAVAGQVCELHVGSFEDSAALDRFAAGLARVTYEFENIPAAALHHLAQALPVDPPPSALEIGQDRLREKSLFARLGIPTARFEAVDSLAELEAAVGRVGLPAVLKTRRLGYDGKGQFVLRDAAQVADAWRMLSGVPLILESFVPFSRELSILAVRGRCGEQRFYPLVENYHRGGILARTIAPAPTDSSDAGAALQAQAELLASAVLDELDYVGVLAIELFQLGGQLLANELAPRVHNTGHWTLDAAETSQFESHLRAILGLPLGSTQARGHAVMLNLIGEAPDVARLLEVPGACVHLYGKLPRPGRKLGHVTFCGLDERQALQRAALIALPSAPEPGESWPARVVPQ